MWCIFLKVLLKIYKFAVLKKLSLDGDVNDNQSPLNTTQAAQTSCNDREEKGRRLPI
jgi:hypothetical protein